MPELPDISLYVHALKPRVQGQELQAARLGSPFFLRSYDPPLAEVVGKEVTDVERIGKRIILVLDDDYFLVFHLMISGRFQWRPKAPKIGGRRNLAAFDFASGSLLVTEASPQQRASLYVVKGRSGLAEHDRGGLDVFDIDHKQFRERLQDENHTLKRSLTDPRLFSGIGNAYSDEILHAARLSPVKLSQSLSADECDRLHRSCQEVLLLWMDRLRDEVGDGFPKEVTAFRPDMAVHGRYRQPCPDCGDPVQRIVYASNETNYCATCQNGGRLLADRALSRLLKKDWPRSQEELEQHFQRRTET